MRSRRSLGVARWATSSPCRSGPRARRRCLPTRLPPWRLCGGPVRPAPWRDQRLSRADAARSRARRRPDAGRLHPRLPRLCRTSMTSPRPAPGCTRSPTGWLSTRFACARSSASSPWLANSADPRHPRSGWHSSRTCRVTSNGLSTGSPSANGPRSCWPRSGEMMGASSSAAALGTSHVAARALLTRARESLRRALAEERAADAEAELDAAARPPRPDQSSEAPRTSGLRRAAPSSRPAQRPACPGRESSPRTPCSGSSPRRTPAWLGDHLAGCGPCRATADAFAADAALLRGLRDEVPPVARDFGARVSLALDDEVRRAMRPSLARRVMGRGSGGRASVRRPSLCAFAGMAALAMVALLLQIPSRCHGHGARCHTSCREPPAAGDAHHRRHGRGVGAALVRRHLRDLVGAGGAGVPRR